MATGSSGSRARIDPPVKAIYLGLGWNFTLLVDGQVDAGATWTVSDPAIGWFASPGVFNLYEQYRASVSTLTARSSDGKASATATVYVLVQAPFGLGDKPALVDDFAIPGVIQSVRWNDEKGRRAALLAYDVLNQLPKAFLDAIGQVAIIRAQALPSGALGQHWPLFDNPVLIAEDKVVSKLQITPDLNDADYDFCDTFFHELAHVALTRRAISDVDKVLLIGVTVGSAIGSAAAAPLSLAALTLSPAYVYLRYFSLFSGEDFASEFARVGGWVINNTNPFSFLWHDTTKIPNAVSGWSQIGWTVKLRNTNRANVPILFDPNAQEAAFQAAGFASSYGATDVHEDWAESLTAIAFDKPVASTPAFKPRRDFIIGAGVWPKGSGGLEVGKTYFEWTRAQKPPLPPPDLSQFRVYFGFFSGKPRDTKPVLKISAFRMKAEAEEDIPPAATSARDREALLAEDEGFGKPDSSVDLYRDAVAARLEISAHLDGQGEGQTLLDSAAGPAREAIASILSPAGGAGEPADDGGRLIDLLRLAERHGEGLVAVSVTPQTDRLLLTPGGAAAGDLLFAPDGSCLVVASVDSEGRILSAAALPSAPEPDGNGLPKPNFTKQLDPTRFAFRWRPTAEPRRWTAEGATAYADLSADLAALIGLWGETQDERGRDLSLAGNFAAQTLRRMGIEAKGLRDEGAEGLEAFFEARGHEMRTLGKAGIEDLRPGDLVRLRRGKLWAVCLAVAPDRETLDLLVQGGVAPGFCEPENAVCVKKGQPANALDRLWRPSAAAG
ncbi:hypothetical protein NPA31_010570 [Aurantimonas sp. MSK8Z-1]|uniref:hypothetical protein n=1 Tax=Mangrovibrevibacter kandeliae TaxID=2968473 RepID=UPI0021197D68|nr:hypothetical protein [Aurantimonas sp. MSK8Z-1]MCW4115403.1 hypothetical protein [Aurantimonas sp. MSK8Z-1]